MHSTPCPVLCHTHVPMRSHTHTDTHLHTHTGSHASKRQNNYLKKTKELTDSEDTYCGSKHTNSDSDSIMRDSEGRETENHAQCVNILSREEETPCWYCN